MLYWESKKVKSFVDDVGTRFIRGPFEENGEVYDFKFITKEGHEDFCMKSQMLEWDITMVRVLNTNDNSAMTWKDGE